MRLEQRGQSWHNHIGGNVEGLPLILSALPSPVAPNAPSEFYGAERATHGVSRSGGMSPPASASTSTSTSTCLVIHFDINETILIGDEAGGDTVDDVVNKMIAKSAFVRIPATADSAAATFDTHSVVPTHWWDGSPIREDSDPNGASNSLAETPPPAPLYTGWDWPDQCCPYYRTAYKKRSKSFVRHHGAAYMPLYRRIHEQLLKARGDHILPAFFRTLVELTARQVPHTVVFRTFGSDLDRVAAAVSDFATGKHPDHPHFVNPNYVLNPSNLYRGRWVPKRQSEIPKATIGSEVTNNDDVNSEFVYQLTEYAHKDGSIVVAEGDEKVLDRLHTCSICGIQDDYEFWSANDCQPWAGKPVWKVPVPPTQSQTYYHHILFDDNIHNLEFDSIASVRVPCTSSLPDGGPSSSSESYRTLTGRETLREQGIHLIRVPTIEPVVNEHWFIEQIDRISRNLGLSAAASRPPPS
jgi:hypothetical protein